MVVTEQNGMNVTKYVILIGTVVRIDDQPHPFLAKLVS